MLIESGSLLGLLLFVEVEIEHCDDVDERGHGAFTIRCLLSALELMLLTLEQLLFVPL